MNSQLTDNSTLAECVAVANAIMVDIIADQRKAKPSVSPC
jgi:hypothetical protein